VRRDATLKTLCIIMSVSSLDDLQQEIVEYISRRAKDALEKVSATEGESYRLVAGEFTDASALWRRIKIVICTTGS
jgi:hypothetical protein